MNSANNNQVRISQSPQGYRLANDDQTDIVILGPRGVTAARLPPYPGWNYLRDRANAAWQEWKKETARHPIERLGVRYINRIDVPIDAVVPFRVQDYVTFYPTVTPITDKDPLGYFVQVVIPTLSPKWNATLTSTTLGADEVPRHVSLILDIDVMRTVDIPLNDTQLWPTIDEAQALKNDIFERCITPTARKLFQS